MRKILKRKSFVILGALVSLANCGQYPRYPNPAAQNQKIQTPAPTTNTITNNNTSKNSTSTNSTGNYSTAPEQPKSTENKKTTTTNPVTPKNDLVKTQLTPFDLFRTGLDYSVKKNESTPPPVAAKVDVHPVEDKETKVENKKNALANAYLNNGSMNNIFNKYAESKVDPTFSLEAYTKLLSDSSLTRDESDTLLEKYFEIVENNNPELKKTLPIEERVKETLNLPQATESVNFQVSTSISDFGQLPSSLKTAATPLAYALILEDKINRIYLSGRSITDKRTDFTKRLKVVTNKNEDKSLVTKSLRLLTLDFSKGKLSTSESSLLAEFSRIYLFLESSHLFDKNVKFSIIGHSQKMATNTASNTQILKDTNQVMSFLTASKSTAFATWKLDSKGWSESLNAKNPQDPKNRYVEIVMSSGESN